MPSTRSKERILACSPGLDLCRSRRGYHHRGASIVEQPIEPSPPARSATSSARSSVGYQGWFAATGDGAPINGWWHWSQNWGQPPSPSNTTIVSWPDMREYTHAYTTAYANLGNGQPAKLFSSYDQQTVDTHFKWMREYGCDTAALQRFNPFGGEGPTRDAMAVKVRAAAEAYRPEVLHHVRRHQLDQHAVGDQDRLDDQDVGLHLVAGLRAAERQAGRVHLGLRLQRPRPPVRAGRLPGRRQLVQGSGLLRHRRRARPGGAPGSTTPAPGFFGVYHAFNMISPWMVGRTGDLAGLDSYYNNVNVGDQADCNASGIDYQPCVMPGDLSSGPGSTATSMWRHFYNMVRLGCQGIYISMFDEYNEGNQIAKTAENASMQPTNFGHPRPRRGRHRLLLGLLPAHHRRRRPDAQGADRADRRSGRPQPIVGDAAADRHPVNLALGKPTTASSINGGFRAGNAVDNNPATYWESVNGAFPQWLQVDLGAAATSAGWC